MMSRNNIDRGLLGQEAWIEQFDFEIPLIENATPSTLHSQLKTLTVRITDLFSKPMLLTYFTSPNSDFYLTDRRNTTLTFREMRSIRSAKSPPRLLRPLTPASTAAATANERRKPARSPLSTSTQQAPCFQSIHPSSIRSRNRPTAKRPSHQILCCTVTSANASKRHFIDWCTVGTQYMQQPP